MRLAWLTDVHLDCVNDLEKSVLKILESSESAEGFLITGDISISSQLLYHLRILDAELGRPIYFILGNHDYYGSSVDAVRKVATEFSNSSSYMKYMTAVSYMNLAPGVNLIGHDGWYDAGFGNYQGSKMLLNDWVRISDFSVALKSSPAGTSINKDAIVRVARTLAHQGALHIANGIKAVVKDSKHVVIMTHVPPFRESYNHERYVGIQTADVIPWYTSKIIGETLLAAARSYPNVKFTVLSGHTHSHYDEQIQNNLLVKVGKSAYGNPQIASFIDI